MYNTGAERSISQKYAVKPGFVLFLAGIAMKTRRGKMRSNGGAGMIFRVLSIVFYVLAAILFFTNRIEVGAGDIPDAAESYDDLCLFYS